MTLETAALRFTASCPNGRGWKALCPICQPDGGGAVRLKIRDDRAGRWRVKCDENCDEEAIVTAVGLTLDDQFLDAKPMRGLTLRGFAGDFQPVEMRHLAAPYLPEGKCVLFDADGGTGKTSLSLAWAAIMSRGLHPVTFRPLEGDPVRCLYLHKGEDTDEELYTVYLANGGVPGMILFAGDDLTFNDDGARRVQEAIEDGGFRFVVCDAFFYFIPSDVRDTNDNLAAIKVVTRINDVARNTGATFLNIRHTTKDALGKAASNLGMGSVAFRNSHRGQLVARWHGGKDQKGVVFLSDEKGSLLNERGEPLAYRRSGLQIEYVHDVPDPSEGPNTTKPLSRLDAAKNLLREELARGERPTKEIERLADRRSISERTLNQARKQLQIESHKSNEGQWMLSMPYDPYSDQ